MRTYDNDDCGRNSASGQIVTQTISLNSRYKCWVPFSEVFQAQCRFPLFPLPSEMSQIKAHRPRVAGAEFPTAGGILPEVLPRWLSWFSVADWGWPAAYQLTWSFNVIQTQSKPEVNQMKLIELGWTWYVNYYIHYCKSIFKLCAWFYTIRCAAAAQGRCIRCSQGQSHSVDINAVRRL